MANKTVSTRIQNKNDTSANWASATTFIPLKGEIIFYTDLNKFKIGDGLTLVNDLAFIEVDKADSATKATQDGNGNNIVNTYALKTAAVNSLSVSGTTLSYKDVNGTQLGSVTLPSSTDTKNTAGSSNSTSKLFLVGTTSQSSTGVQSYSNSSVYTEAGQLYTKSLRVSENASIGTELDVIGLIAVTDSGVQVNDDNNNYTGTDNFSSADIDTTYYSKGMAIYNNDNDTTFNLSYPAKSGTLATTADIPTYSYDSSTGTLSITTNS